MEYNDEMEKFHAFYTDPESDIFLSKNVKKLVKFARNRPGTGNLTEEQILRYMNTISDISRDRERRILRGKKRVMSTRKYIFFGPHNWLLADTFFIRDIRNPVGKKPLIGVIYMDGFR